MGAGLPCVVFKESGGLDTGSACAIAKVPGCRGTELISGSPSFRDQPMGRDVIVILSMFPADRVVPLGKGSNTPDSSSAFFSPFFVTMPCRVSSARILSFPARVVEINSRLGRSAVLTPASIPPVTLFGTKGVSRLKGRGGGARARIAGSSGYSFHEIRL